MCTKWAAASAAESVMVMMKSVVAKPRRTSTKTLPVQPGEQLFQHRNAALAVGAGGSDAIVNRQRGEEGYQDEDKGCDRREETGSEESDTGLVTEGGEVVDPGEAHDAPPRMFAGVAVSVSTLGAFEIREKPIGERQGRFYLLNFLLGQPGPLH